MIYSKILVILPLKAILPILFFYCFRNAYKSITYICVSIVTIIPIAPTFAIARSSDVEAILNTPVLKPIPLKTRPSIEFISNFLLYYKIAVDRAPLAEFNDLKDLLRMSRNSPISLVKYLHAILSTVAFRKQSNPLVKYLPAAFSTIAFSKESHQFPTELEVRSDIELAKNKGHYALLTQSMKDRIFLKKIRLDQLNWEVIPVQGKLNFLMKKLMDFLGYISTWNIAKLEGRRVKRVQTRKIEKRDMPIKFKESGYVVSFAREFLQLKDGRAESARIERDIENAEEFKREIYATDKDMQPCELTSFKLSQSGIDQLQVNLKALESDEVYSLPLEAGSLDTIKNQIIQDVKKKIEVLKEKENALLRRIQTYPPELQLQVEAGLIEPLTVSRCIGYYGCQDYSGLVHANPSLEPQLDQLKQDITDYLIEKTELQLLKRSLDLLNKTVDAIKSLGGTRAIIENAADAFIRSFMAKRAYAEDHPHADRFIVYEAFLHHG